MGLNRQKINCFEDTLIERVFWRFFWFVSKNSVCFGCFDTGPKHRNKLKKKFLVSRNKPKINRNRLSFSLFRYKPRKKIDCFEDPLGESLQYPNEKKSAVATATRMIAVFFIILINFSSFTALMKEVFYLALWDTRSPPRIKALACGASVTALG